MAIMLGVQLGARLKQPGLEKRGGAGQKKRKLPVVTLRLIP